MRRPMGPTSPKNSRAKSTFTTATGCEFGVSPSVIAGRQETGCVTRKNIPGYVGGACAPLLPRKLPIQGFYSVVQATFVRHTEPNRGAFHARNPLHRGYAPFDEVVECSCLVIARVV